MESGKPQIDKFKQAAVPLKRTRTKRAGMIGCARWLGMGIGVAVRIFGTALTVLSLATVLGLITPHPNQGYEMARYDLKFWPIVALAGGAAAWAFRRRA